MTHGLTQVAALEGGWAAWQRAGLPVEGRDVVVPAVPTLSPDALAAMTALGSADAPITIYEFSDYQCPYCRRYTLETLPRLKEAYIDTGIVRYVFQDFPLPLHTNAFRAAEAARCAGLQGAFWAMHDRLFSAQGDWARQDPTGAGETFVRFAGELGLDGAVLRRCLEEEETGALIRQDQWAGEQAGVSGTPSFLVNDQLLVGAHAFEAFQRLIETELDEAP